MIKAVSHTELANEKFVGMLPLITKLANFAFRGYSPEVREDLIAEVVANAFRAFTRLLEQGKQGVAYPTPLAQYAIRQVRAGRRVGGKMNVLDVSSSYCRRAKGINLLHFDDRKHRDGEWKEFVAEDRRASPADLAAFRLDFAEWIRTLPNRNRQIALLLARGETPRYIAKLFHVSSGRVSQLRKELRQSWEAFQSEELPASAR